MKNNITLLKVDPLKTNIFTYEQDNFKNTEIDYYIKHKGFKYVCGIELQDYNNGSDRWLYCEIEKDIMYSKSKGWIYIITLEGEIFKIGETGQPLGIRNKRTGQPLQGSKSRLGRYLVDNMQGKKSQKDDSDKRVRELAYPHLIQGKKMHIFALDVSHLTEAERRLREEVMIKDYRLLNNLDRPLGNLCDR